MTDPITPEEFASRLKELANMGDIETAHAEADELMEEILTQLGYGEGIKVFEAMDKWYA